MNQENNQILIVNATIDTRVNLLVKLLKEKKDLTELFKTIKLKKKCKELNEHENVCIDLEFRLNLRGYSKRKCPNGIRDWNEFLTELYNLSQFKSQEDDSIILPPLKYYELENLDKQMVRIVVNSALEEVKKGFKEVVPRISLMLEFFGDTRLLLSFVVFFNFVLPLIDSTFNIIINRT